MPAPPNTLALVEAFCARLAAINGTGDYHTAAGARVYRGRMLFDARSDGFPLITVQALSGAEEENNGQKIREVITVAVDGHTRIDRDHPQDALHQLLADIKRAVDPSTQLPGAQKITYEGWEIFDAEIDSYVGSVRVNYLVTHIEAYGQS